MSKFEKPPIAPIGYGYHRFSGRVLSVKHNLDFCDENRLYRIMTKSRIQNAPYIRELSFDSTYPLIKLR